MGLNNEDCHEATVDPEATLAILPQISGNISALVEDNHNLHNNSSSHINVNMNNTNSTWRQQHRIKTVGVAIILCLHIGVDPPDTPRPSTEAARLECWIDPLSMPPDKARESISRTLQQQYEYWQPRARYRAVLDPTADDVRKLLGGLRKGGKGDRILVHYNGHGVPRPTRNGELWLFNKQFTQYIPMHVKELFGAVDGAGMYVFDCSAAGALQTALLKAADDTAHDLLILSACAQGEVLPVLGGSDTPADLFTSCLTTPMEVALREFPREDSEFLSLDAGKRALELPGRLNDRTSVLGELNWILTAITDTIAWQLLDRPLFQRLFRQDLLVAALFKNFLLACRVMRRYGCNPLSHPPLPSSLIANHSLWHAWAYEVDRCLSSDHQPTVSHFFQEQRFSFDSLRIGNHNSKLLPVLLQLLLSQSHRAMALESFATFMSTDDQRIEDVLTVGLFPYILKLLQSPAVEIRRPLLQCWLRVFFYDPGCRLDLEKDDSMQYFVHSLFEAEYPDDDDEGCRIYSCAILTKFLMLTDSPSNLLIKAEQAGFLLKLLSAGKLGVWKLILLGTLLAKCPHLRLSLRPVTKLIKRVDDPDLRPSRSCRQAAVYCLGQAIRDSSADELDSMIQSLLLLVDDPSRMVREEALTTLSVYISSHFSTFTRIAYAHQNQSGLDDSLQSAVWKAILCFAMDPVERISRLAGHVIDEVHMSFLFPAASSANTKASSQHSRQESGSLPAEIVFMSHSAKSQSTTNLLILESDDTNSEDNIRRIHHRIASDDDTVGITVMPRIELESVLPIASTFPDTMFKELLLNAPADKKTTSDQRYPVQFQFEIEDALESIKDPKRQLVIIDTEQPVISGVFIPSNNKVVTADQESMITVWQYQKEKGTDSGQTSRTNFFRNGKCGLIRSMCLTASADEPLLVVSSADGCIRCWRDFEYGHEVLVSAWSTANPAAAGPIVELQRNDNRLVFTESNDSVISTWHLSEEKLLTRRVLNNDHVVSVVVSSDFVPIIATLSGRILLLDERMKELLTIETASDKKTKSHLCLFDIRQSKRLWEKKLEHSLVSCHPQLPVVAAAHGEAISFFGLEGDNHEAKACNTVRYHEGLLGRRLATTNALFAHPNRPFIAAAGKDCTLSIFK